MDASPPQSSPIPFKALLSPRPNSHIAHPYPRSDKGGEIGESRPHSPSSLSKRFLSCPLAARQLPYRGHCDPTRNFRSGRAGNRPPFIKVRRCPTGNIRSPTTRYRSHMTTLTRSGNKAAPRPRSVAGTSAIQCGPLANAGSALQSSPVC